MLCYPNTDEIIAHILEYFLPDFFSKQIDVRMQKHSISGLESCCVYIYVK